MMFLFIPVVPNFGSCGPGEWVCVSDLECAGLGPDLVCAGLVPDPAYAGLGLLPQSCTPQSDPCMGLFHLACGAWKLGERRQC